ncbi:LRP chaperone MESD [Echeneis naucrates]|uniref:LRP chaperone MESD n=1 Tax=Echeneis naucrates TaxID=173247 RepID=A0A665TRA6_ECHNA|nr:LRP chaperone MESD [Echeneis naucrates]XP_029353327.1 LRP chaperone MESD [Echeneis naucrates]XP_029353328.1 LRP chaperone MESD [Echeneis naucrates]
MASDFRWRCVVLLLCTYLLCISGPVGGEQKEKKKDIRDYNDADMARLLEQWEKDDDIEEGDLPEHRRSPPPVDFSKVDPSKPEELLKLSKKGRTLMVFATVSGDPTEKETEEITGLWQGSLFNANFDVQRFVVGSNRVIFMLRDGSMAWEVKDFLVSQERCVDVTVEGQVFPGKAGKKDDSKYNQQNEVNAKKTKKKTESKKPDIKGNSAKHIKKEL